MKRKNKSYAFGALVVMTLVSVLPTTATAQSAGLRQKNMQAQIKSEVGSFLRGLSLPDPTVAAIEFFLLQRGSAVADAVDTGIAGGFAEAGKSDLIVAARQQWDNQIDTIFDAATASLVKDIVRNYVGYSQISRLYGPHMVAQGVPLSSSQVQQLANALYNCNSALVNPSSVYMRKSVDPVTGLSDLDTQLLSSVSSFLSPAQKTVLQADLVKITSAIVSGKLVTS